MLSNTTQPILLYDGDCLMCRGTIRLLDRVGLTRGISVRPWLQTDLPNEDLAERIRREILLYDPETREVLGGIPVLIRLIELHPGCRWLAPLLKWSPISRLLAYFYRIIAMNRRILSPPPHRELPCACDPPDDPAARRQLYLILMLFTLFGMVVFALANSSAPIFGSAWVLFKWLATALLFAWIPSWLAGFLVLRSRMRELIQQSLVVSAIGGMWLLILSPVLWIARLTGVMNASMAPVGFLIAIVAMNYSLRHRLRILAFPGWLHWVWLFSILALSTPLWLD